MAAITDLHGRTMRKLRISVTEACNFRCVYCMPHGGPAVMRPDHLDARGYADIARVLVEAGVRELRVTGGEPTLRPDLPEILAALGGIPEAVLTMTTNGERLPPLFPALHRAGARGLNISLDSLREDRFRAVTSRRLGPVLEAVRGAVSEGFRVKLNCVVCRGRNDDEALDFVDFAAREGVEVRFLELMRIGPGALSHARDFVPAAEIEERLRDRHMLAPLDVPSDSTAYRFQLDNGALVGFVASESRPFCGGCSRLRLSARGELRACLMKPDHLPLAGLGREAILEAARELVHWKPTGRIGSIDQAMHGIGG
jgi:cyclic pyranopterin phosphate synthase